MEKGGRLGRWRQNGQNLKLPNKVRREGVGKVINARIAEFASHLANYELTEDEICQFIAENTLSHLQVQGIFLTEITNRRTARARASFGINQSEFPEWQEFPIEWKLPVTDALTEKRLVWVTSLPQWPEEYPLVAQVEFPFPARTHIVTPILRFNDSVGCFGIFSSLELTPDEETELLLQTIGHLISLHIYRKERERAKKESPNVTSLTDRQIEILMHISEKKTNIEIADIMGYSESTIRQETIRIFEKLHLSGRNEARRYFLENKDRFGISARSKGEVPSSREEFAH